MPDLNNRADFEAEVALALARLGQRQQKLLLDALGDPPDLNKVTPEFWNEFSTQLRGELLPALERIFLHSAEQMLSTSPVGVDWSLVNGAAASWAERYTFDLVSGITQNTRTALQQKVGAYYRSGLSLGDLRASLANLFGPVRAEMIAVTETTRAAVNGELAIAAGIREQGINMVAVWQTSNDETVCPVCSPNNQKVQGTTWTVPPPAHPRCRCWLSHTFADLAR